MTKETGSPLAVKLTWFLEYKMINNSGGQTGKGKQTHIDTQAESQNEEKKKQFWKILEEEGSIWKGTKINIGTGPLIPKKPGDMGFKIPSENYFELKI